MILIRVIDRKLPQSITPQTQRAHACLIFVDVEKENKITFVGLSLKVQRSQQPWPKLCLVVLVPSQPALDISLVPDSEFIFHFLCKSISEKHSRLIDAPVQRKLLFYHYSLFSLFRFHSVYFDVEQLKGSFAVQK